MTRLEEIRAMVAAYEKGETEAERARAQKLITDSAWKTVPYLLDEVDRLAKALEEIVDQGDGITALTHVPTLNAIILRVVATARRALTPKEPHAAE